MVNTPSTAAIRNRSGAQPPIDQLRTTLRDCLRHTGSDVTVHERQGPYPSPTLVINGIDVATGAPPSDTMCCRLDVPTHDQIHTVLTNAVGS